MSRHRLCSAGLATALAVGLLTGCAPAKQDEPTRTMLREPGVSQLSIEKSHADESLNPNDYRYEVSFRYDGRDPEGLQRVLAAWQRAIQGTDLARKPGPLTVTAKGLTLNLPLDYPAEAAPAAAGLARPEVSKVTLNPSRATIEAWAVDTSGNLEQYCTQVAQVQLPEGLRTLRAYNRTTGSERDCH